MYLKKNSLLLPLTIAFLLALLTAQSGAQFWNPWAAYGGLYNLYGYGFGESLPVKLALK